MANIFSRSWEITKLSFNVIKQDKEMIAFPILAGVFSLIFMAAMILPTLGVDVLSKLTNNQTQVFSYMIIFLVYLGLAFIATFFNVCVVFTTKTRFKGGDATFGDSLSFAFSKIHLIFSWSLVAATVGLLLRILDSMARKTKGVGRIIFLIMNSILGMVWSILTIFVVPGMVYYNLGPIAAIKKSAITLKRTWGESLIRYYGLGIAQFLFIILGIIIAIPIILFGALLGPIGITIAIIALIIYFLGVILVFTVANSVFNTALFVYADTGKIPLGFNEEVMKHTFKSTKPGII